MDELKKKRLITWIAIGAAALVIFLIVFNSVKNSRQNGSLKANRELIASLFGEKTENLMENKGVNEKRTPENAKSFVIVRFDSKGNVKNFITRGLDASKEWTEEELLGVDCIVFAFYDFGTHTYSETENGRATGRTTNVTTDRYEMYYYDPAEDVVFKRETLNSGGLPGQTTNPKSTSVTDGELVRTVKDALGMFYIPTSTYAVAAMIAITGGLMAVFIGLSVRKLKNKRAK